MKPRTKEGIEKAFHEMGIDEGVKENKYYVIRVCESSSVTEEDICISYDNNSTSEVDNA